MNKKSNLSESVKNSFTQELYEQALFAAMVYNDLEMTQWIRERKEDIDYGIHGRLAADEGITLLQIASSRGYLCLVKILLEAGADHGCVRGGVGTGPALHCAVRHGRLDVIERLLDYGTNINSIDRYGRTPVKIAINYEKHDSLKLLAARGADLKVMFTVDFFTPLMLAAFNNNYEAVSILLSFGVKLNAINNNGDTALIIASRKGSVMCIQKLLDAGAESKTRNYSGENPFLLALNRPDIVDLFLSRNRVSIEECLEAIHWINVRIVDRFIGEKSLEIINEYMKNKEFESDCSGLSL